MENNGQLENPLPTLEFLVFNAIVSNWSEKDSPRFAQILKSAIVSEITQPHYKWVLKSLSN